MTHCNYGSILSWAKAHCLSTQLLPEPVLTYHQWRSMALRPILQEMFNMWICKNKFENYTCKIPSISLIGWDLGNWEIALWNGNVITLTHCGLVVPYGDIDLGQHRLRWWLLTWWHKVITWTYIDISSKVFGGFCIWAILQEVLMNFIHNMCSEITLLELLAHLSGAGELTIKAKTQQITFCRRL